MASSNNNQFIDVGGKDRIVLLLQRSTLRARYLIVICHRGFSTGVKTPPLFPGKLNQMLLLCSKLQGPRRPFVGKLKVETDHRIYKGGRAW